MPDAVSIPHEWGHDVDRMQLSVPRERAGVNSNLLADEFELDPLSGNAALSAIPVELRPA